MTEDMKACKDILSLSWPRLETVTLTSTESTNTWLRQRREQMLGHTCLVIADEQTAGRGSGTNHWESAPGENLTFSLQVCPTALPANRMFALSQVMALGVAQGLEHALGIQDGEGKSGVSIKWPNDVYYHDGKVCGMLIENDLCARRVELSVMGVGINVNQTLFVSDAPNPLSLKQIAGHDFRRSEVLSEVLACTRFCYEMMEHGAYDSLHDLYLTRLYRKGEWHQFTDQGGTFDGMIRGVQPDGHLIVQGHAGGERKYAFGEIKYII